MELETPTRVIGSVAHNSELPRVFTVIEGTNLVLGDDGGFISGTITSITLYDSPTLEHAFVRIDQITWDAVELTRLRTEYIQSLGDIVERLNWQNFYTSGDYILDASASNVPLHLYGDTVIGSNSGDTLYGNYVHGLDGPDRIWTLGDNATVYGGDGADSFILYNGGNTAFGGPDYDYFFVDATTQVAARDGLPDTIDGGEGIDTVHYNFGHSDYFQAIVDLEDNSLNAGVAAGDILISIENIVGTPYHDALYGDENDNYISGGWSGSDTLVGRGGDDVLVVTGAGWQRLDYTRIPQVMDGGPGDDQFYIRDFNGTLEYIQLIGGPGVDSLAFTQVDFWVNVDMAGVFTNANGLEVAMFQGIEIVSGSHGGDTLLGNTEDNALIGLEGDDTIAGRDGSDLLLGGEGNDHLEGGAGADTLDGGGGDDTAIQNSTFASAWAVDLGGGQTLVVSAFGADIFSNIEFLEFTDGTFTLAQLVTASMNRGLTATLTAGDDTIVATMLSDLIDGDAGDDSISGGDGNDGLRGEDGNDTLDGGAGDDSLPGADGDDVLIGGTGNDRMGGGNGNDLMQGGDGNDSGGGGPGNDTMEGGDGADLLSGGSGMDSVDGGAGNDTLAGSFGSDTVNGGAGDDPIGGGHGFDLISGGDGNDTIGAGGHDDTVTGNAGNDFVGGGDGNDSLDGGTGMDTLNGGNGDDTLTGGADADVFVFNNRFGDGADVVTDFEDGVDLIRLVGLPPIADPMARVTITDGATGAQVTYGNFTITVEGVTAAALTVDDFQFV